MIAACCPVSGLGGAATDSARQAVIGGLIASRWPLLVLPHVFGWAMGRVGVGIAACCLSPANGGSFGFSLSMIMSVLNIPILRWTRSPRSHRPGTSLSSSDSPAVRDHKAARAFCATSGQVDIFPRWVPSLKQVLVDRLPA
jgi:hypothetical protein